MIYLKNILTLIIKSKALIAVSLFVSLLLIPSIFAPPQKNLVKESISEQEILGAKEEVNPTPTLTPTPTPVLVASKIPTPTPTPTPSSPTPTPTPQPTNSSSSNSPSPTPTSTPTPTPIATPTPTPTPEESNVEIGIDYAGQKASDTYTVSINPGQTAWEAIVSGVGIENLQYTDYGGDLGIFITGFNGSSAAPNQFYEFRVNGASSSVGVSTYQCNDGDRLDFVLTTF